MKRKYHSAFIVPLGANKFLGEYGWEFRSLARLPEEIISQLIEALNLDFVERYLGIESYANDNMKMSVVFDNKKKIENIHFQLYGCSMSKLSDVYDKLSVCSHIELFTPPKEQNP